MKTETPSREYPLLLGIRAFDLAYKYGWKPKAKNWHERIIQAIECKFIDEYMTEWFIAIDDLPKEDRLGIADTLEQTLNEIPDNLIEIECACSFPFPFPMSNSRYGKSLFYKLAFWSEHKADLKEFIQLLR